MNRMHSLMSIATAMFVTTFSATVVNCTPQQAQTAANIALKVADGLCTEEAQQPNEPDWVALACQIEGVAGGIAHVLLSRDQWDQIKGRKAPPCWDAGPSTFAPGPGK